MITSTAFRGKRYAVLGLARSGRATVDALLTSGAEVVAWDSNEDAREALVRNAELSFADPLETDLTGFAGVVVSPGVPLNRHPIAAHAAKFGVPVIGDIELFAQGRAELPPHKVVGITGTNGKSTTTALVHHILQSSGVPTMMGGNIGLPILGQEPLPTGGVYVLELSSYQIDLTFSLDCDVAVLLNITPDHLDRYDGFDGYAASKARLFAMQSTGHPAIRGTTPTLDQFNWAALQGPHNAQNAAAAIAVCKALGLTEAQIETGLQTYPGLPHRMERIRERDGVLYVNDSKATNATSTAPALAAYSQILWILGGQAKSDDLDACAPYFDHVKTAFAIGRDGPMLANILRDQMPVVHCVTLDVAVHRASMAAHPGDTVLLSPACASFDQFTDFEARGDAFRALVEAL
ncbi:UDP-N-acetylmuramoyl-L-alanine--D-glutamate ligase [Sphingomonas paeninsulae]|uniref:UDP-N-acetylmuramoylalanine--D-glutamate ligase n=1 Tax=Sphingomonas paeninsulae TaxID=2319844 RepID=A0A494TNU2_SPHPE|nr:UDP-N-acetylmuramoyl-L-alanine--D-glutamate ligase [Sphingomonas paeninsulae]AYJ87148.1 UDP-N-acetylmuramoyl-L-alanine--D-glutamate ligase [Sphingomonas paeninsulae]